MPNYEYECPACGCKFEVMLGYEDRALVRCPKCKTVARRLISVVNHTFGWRLTDASHERFSEDEWERDV